MLSSVLEACFRLLRDVSKEMKSWQDKSLDEIPDEDILKIIEILEFFLELREESKKGE